MKYQGEFPNIIVPYTNKDCLNGMITFAKKYEVDNTYGYKKGTSDEKTHQCPICHPDSGKGGNCIGWCSAIAYHGGTINTVKCACNGMLYDSLGTNLTLEKGKERNGKDWKMISNGGKKNGSSIKQADLVEGTFLVCYDKSGTYKHMAGYLGNGYIIDDTSSRGIKKRKYSELTSSLKVTRGFVYTGKGTGKREYLKTGDTGEDVKKLQKFLNGALDLNLSITDTYGDKTTEAVKQFQDKEGIIIDGYFGKTSLEYAKKFDKPNKVKYTGELPNGEYTFTQPVKILQATHNRKKWNRGGVYSTKTSHAYHGTRVMRSNDSAKRERIAKGMELAVANQKITYSNDNTLYPLAKKVNFDCSRVTQKCTTHCANLLSVALHYAGINTPSSMHAAKVDDELRKLGGFKFYTTSKYTQKTEFLKRGDILQAENCPHVAVVQNDGKYIKTILAYGDKHLAVGKGQAFLNWYFNDSVCEVNNFFDNATQKYTKQFQAKEIGQVAADGIVGQITLKAAKNAER